jgi:hypothetical protein
MVDRVKKVVGATFFSNQKGRTNKHGIGSILQPHLS